MKPATLPKPTIDNESEAFWHGTRDGRFLLKKCTDCGKLHWVPREICPHCMSDKTEWVPSTGKGTIYSWSVVRRGGVEPYTLAYITLDEGITLLSSVINCEIEDMAVGKDVQVTFLDNGDGQAIPYFELV